MTNTENNHGILRQIVHKYEQNNKTHYRDQHYNENITENQHLGNLKNGGLPTKAELYAISAMLRLPITLETSEKIDEIIIGSTESLVQITPPKNLNLGLRKLKNGNYIVLWPNENFLKINTIQNSTTQNQIPSNEQISILQKEDDYCKKWLNYLQTNEIKNSDRKHFELHKDNISLNNDNILIYKRRKNLRQNREHEKVRIVLPKSLISLVLKLSHDNNVAAHPGKHKTWENVSYRFFRPQLHKIVNDYVKDCLICINKNQRPKSKQVTVQKTPKPSRPFEMVSMDIIGPMPVTENGMKYILLIIDNFTRYVEAYPLPEISSIAVAKKLIMEFFSRYGLCEIIHSDNASNFKSEIMEDVFKKLSIKHTKTTSYHAQANGITERANKTIIDSLKCLCDNHQNDWDYQLAFSLWAYRTSINSSIQETPSFCVYGFDPKVPLDLINQEDHKGKYAIGISPHSYGVEMALRLKKAGEWIKEMSDKAADKYTAYANRKKSDTKLQVNDLVMLHTPHIKKGKVKKLSKLYSGPYRILQKTSPVNFEIQLVGKKKKQTVHADRLLHYNPTTNEYREHSWVDNYDFFENNDKENLVQTPDKTDNISDNESVCSDKSEDNIDSIIV